MNELDNPSGYRGKSLIADRAKQYRESQQDDDTGNRRRGEHRLGQRNRHGNGNKPQTPEVKYDMNTDYTNDPAAIYDLLVKKPKEESESSPKKKTKYHNVKRIVLLLLLFILIVSDAFVDTVLARFAGTMTSQHSPNFKGTLVQGAFLVTGYMLGDLLIGKQLI